MIIFQLHTADGDQALRGGAGFQGHLGGMIGIHVPTEDMAGVSFSHDDAAVVHTYSVVILCQESHKMIQRSPDPVGG